MRLRRAAALIVVILVSTARPAWAQQAPFESVGVRALGMGGAFVAVANDATAVYWNPAGLATGGPGGATIEWTRLRSGNPNAAPAGGQGGLNSNLWTLGGGPLGVFFNKTRRTIVTPDTGSGVGLQTFETSQLGASILQSVTKGFVLGTSLKYVRGGALQSGTAATTAEQAVNEGLKLAPKKSGAFDFDAGFMLDFGHLRVGSTWRNLRQPVFVNSAGFAMQLKRQGRAGLAVLPTNGLTLAMDVDLDKVDLGGGLRRMIAVGGEQRLGRRVAVRGGVRWNTLAPGQLKDRLIATVGGSVRIRRGFWLDGFYTPNRFDEDRGFGFALRAGS